MPIFKAFLKEAVAFEKKYRHGKLRVPSTVLKLPMGYKRVPCVINGRDKHGRTPIFLAAMGEDFVRLRLLHEAEAGLNIKNNLGNTPLFCVVASPEKRYESRLTKLDLLLQYGADVDARNNRGRTPIAQAARERNLEAAAFLLEHGAEVNTKDHQGMTPLLSAVKALYEWGPSYAGIAQVHGCHQMVELLLKFGAEVHAVSYFGKNALFFARNEKFGSVSRLLREAGLQEVVGESSESESEPEAACPRFLQRKGNKIQGVVRKWVGKRPPKKTRPRLSFYGNDSMWWERTSDVTSE